VLLRRLRALLVGVVATASLAVPLVVFAHQTLPYKVPTNAAPAVRLAPVDAALAADFPAYAGAVPVINYHDVSARQGVYSTTPETFATQLAALRAAGFTSVTLRDMQDLVAGRPVDLPARPILITFDDAVASQYVNADATLARYGFRAVAFVPTAFVAERTPSYYLTRGEIQQLAGTGRWEFGSHTDSGHHLVRTGTGTAGPWLTNLERRPDGSQESLDAWTARVRSDLLQSVTRLRALTGSTPASLAYPFSAAAFPTNDPQLPPLLESIVAQTFPIAFTASLSTPSAVTADSPRYRLPRLEVTAGTSAADLLQRLAVMVPRPPSADPNLWSITSGGCSVRRGAVVVRASRYVICRPAATGRDWQDYTATVAVAGLGANATGIVTVRNGDDAWAEVAVSDRRYAIRQRVWGRWQVLGAGALSRSAVAARHVLTLDLAGRALRVRIDQVALAPVTLEPALARGALGVAVAPKGRHTLTFTPLSVVPHTALAAVGPTVVSRPPR
jgi:peptidoglycan/xylan/chitin deacetylase (PgdA/CDA1 family)